MFRERKAAAEAHVKGREIKTARRVPAHARGSVVEARVIVAIEIKLDIVRQRGRVEEQRRQFPAFESHHRRRRNAMTLIVVGEAAVITQVRRVLRAAEEEVADIVDGFGESIRDARLATFSKPIDDVGNFFFSGPQKKKLPTSSMVLE